MEAAMTTRPPTPSARAGARIPDIDPLPISLLDDPIEYMIADHTRQRVASMALQHIGATLCARRQEADMLTAFLTRDYALHHDDEMLEFFPAIRRRAMQEDGLGVVLAQLTEDHRSADAVLDRVIATLSANPERAFERFTVAEGEQMQSLATNMARHLMIENAVVMTIARVRLTRRDLRSISKGMKLRRGILNV